MCAADLNMRGTKLHGAWQKRRRWEEKKQQTWKSLQHCGAYNIIEWIEFNDVIVAQFIYRIYRCQWRKKVVYLCTPVSKIIYWLWVSKLEHKKSCEQKNKIAKQQSAKNFGVELAIALIIYVHKHSGNDAFIKSIV